MQCSIQHKDRVLPMVGAGPLCMKQTYTNKATHCSVALAPAKKQQTFKSQRLYEEMNGGTEIQRLIVYHNGIIHGA